jgi:hypothetical protein
MIRSVFAALTVVAALTACAPTLSAQDSPTPSVDSLVAKIGDLRKQRAALDKAEAELRAQLTAELKRIADLVDKLGGGDVKPPDVKPKPPEPPADPLRAKLKAAFDADPLQLDKRRSAAADLAALYRQAAKLAADPEVTTSGALLDRVRQAAGMLVGADGLRDVRRAAGAELSAILPTDADLTAEQRGATAKLFERLAAILEELGK